MKLFVVLLAGLFLTNSCVNFNSTAISIAHAGELYDVPKGVYYFPIGSFTEFNDNAKPDTMLLSWYSRMLRAMKEPVLYDKVEGTETYRFTCLRTFHAPFAIRVSKQGQAPANLMVKISDGAGGYSSENLVSTSAKQISDEEWAQITEALNKNDFWNMPTQKISSGSDGSEWIVEGVKNGKYHVVDRWTPQKGTDYRLIGEKLIEVSGTKFRPLY